MDMPPGYAQERAKTGSEARQAFSSSLTYEEFYGITESLYSYPPGFEAKVIDEKPKVEEKPQIETKPVVETKPVETKPVEVKLVIETKPPVETKQAVVEKSPVEEIKELSQSPDKETSQSPLKESSQSPVKEKAENEEWVTVKNRSRKKGQEGGPIAASPSAKFESLAEQQLSSNKNKKKSIKKKLKEIKDLIQKQQSGEKLNAQQLQKIQNKEKIERELSSLN
ncbi:hypothetical protein SteCoe_24073 [Stentor coeruleus]|uniref:Uncharacterized protein n=1 Tax=Stentor coeruleus TaxID=5963 RepID=A0A1R2BIU6_9CILI|nr:hypothetical protein SteCoe_24073 [Stentor coeruleus]